MEYTEKNDDFNVLDELTSDSYLTITTDVASEIAIKKEEVTSIALQFEDKKREIRVTKNEIARLQRQLKRQIREKREIGRHLNQKQRSLNVDTHFLNQLNRAISRPNGKHMIDKQKRKIF